MSRTYTDEELKIISNLAYCNLDSDKYEELGGGKKPVNLQQLLINETDGTVNVDNTSTEQLWSE